MNKNDSTKRFRFIRRKGEAQGHAHGRRCLPLPGTALEACPWPLAEHGPAGVPALFPVCHASQHSHNSVHRALPTPTCKGGPRRSESLRDAARTQGKCAVSRPVPPSAQGCAHASRAHRTLPAPAAEAMHPGAAGRSPSALRRPSSHTRGGAAPLQARGGCWVSAARRGGLASDWGAG